MQSIRLAYKNDAFGNPIYTRIIWSAEQTSQSKPIGSADIIPQSQIDYLCSSGFVVVAPNYRLAPQATGKEAFGDAEDAFDWTLSSLPQLMLSEHRIALDTGRVVAMGHSSGGTMVLHLASRGKPVRAVLALYPFLFVADKTTNGHQAATGPPFDGAPDHAPSEEDWATIAPAGRQVSEAPLPLEKTSRNSWIMQLFKTGRWMSAVQPDGDFEAIDPMTRIGEHWPPVTLIHGSNDNVSGRSVELMQRAEKAMNEGGVKEVHLEILQGEGHLFDHHPAVGTSDLGTKWQAVLKGLDWLKGHV